MTAPIEAKIFTALISEIFRKTSLGFYVQIEDNSFSDASITQTFYDRGWRGVIGIVGEREAIHIRQGQPDNTIITLPFDVMMSNLSVADVDSRQEPAEAGKSDARYLETSETDGVLSRIDDSVHSRVGRDGIIDMILIGLHHGIHPLVAMKLVTAYRPRVIVLEQEEIDASGTGAILVDQGYKMGFFNSFMQLYYRSEDERFVLPSLRNPLEIYHRSMDVRRVDLEKVLTAKSFALNMAYRENERCRLATQHAADRLVAVEAELHHTRQEAHHLVHILGTEIAASSQDLVRKSLVFGSLLVLPFYTDERRFGARNLMKAFLPKRSWKEGIRDRRIEHAMRARKQIVMQSGLFDGTWYLRQYPDVAVTKVDPLQHFVEHGSLELRHPGPAFDSHAYLERHPDVVTGGLEPLMHYLVFGRAEGRFLWRVAKTGT